MRRALVTGCSSGLGHAITMALLGDGWQVLGISRTRPAIAADGFSWSPIDLAIPYQISTTLPYVLPERLDAVIHCAARQGPVGPFERTDPLAWAGCVKVNLEATALLLSVVLPRLLRSDDARVLLFSGGGAFGPRPRYSAYAASKAGVVAFAESIAAELAGRVSVNCVCPGYVATPIHAATLEAGAGLAGDDEYRQALTAQPFGEEKARVVACVRHLLSEAMRGLTGKSISVPHDRWQDIRPEDVAALNDARVWTRDRVQAGAGVLV